MRTNNYLIFVLICFMTTGCATYGELETDYGKSYHTALSGQILNPGASKNLKPVTGIPGDVAAAGINKYVQSFNKDANKPASKDFIVPAIPKDMAGGQNAYEK